MAQALNNSLFENGILSAPIQLSINGLLYLYNKCNDNLHFLIISYSLVRGATTLLHLIQLNTVKPLFLISLDAYHLCAKRKVAF